MDKVAFDLARLFCTGVTLTFAQSVDGIIGGVSESISCRESLLMTHVLRSSHAAILVGITTVLVDDPSLTARHNLGPDIQGCITTNNPIVLVVDTNMRTPLSAKFIKRNPIILYHYPSQNEQKLREIGAILVKVPLDNGRLDLKAALIILREQFNITSIMVEGFMQMTNIGGSKIIQSFLSSGLVDSVIITIAPKFIGSGVRAVPALYISPLLEDIHYQQFGVDIVLFGRVAKQ
jgi:riboflavin-specific deaminase-like protein